MSKEEKKRAKLKELGIDYDFPGYVCTDFSYSAQGFLPG